jgi:hypothetical protein
MVRPGPLCLLLAPVLLVLGCAEPCAACRIGRYLGRTIGELMRDRALEPRAVLPEAAGGKTYIFEVRYLTTAVLPPVGPATPLNIENTPAQVQLNPSPHGAYTSGPPLVVPGMAAPAALIRVPTLGVRILRVRTTADGIIQEYSSKAS